MMRVVHNVRVYGSTVDDQTRCSHYLSSLDIVAIKFRCCEKWFPCRTCHDEAESHSADVWPREEFNTPAVLCGCCGRLLSISEYFGCGNECPACGSGFNPGCEKHYHLYFDVDQGTNPAGTNSIARMVPPVRPFRSSGK
jgi:uncharacterized CHY-type Zn-finger protein